MKLILLEIITELENKIRDVRGLAIKSVLRSVENKVPDVSFWLRKQIMTQKLVNLRSNLLIIVMANILLLQSLIL